MLDRFFADPRSRGRIEKAPFKEYLVATAKRLQDQGYCRLRIQGCLRAGASFLRWLKEKDIPPQQAGKAHLRQFMLETMTARRDGRQVANSTWNTVHAGVAHLLRTLRAELGEIPPATPADASVVAFRKHLREQCGYASSTIYERTVFLKEFLHHHFGEGPVDVQRLSGGQILEYVSGEVHRRSPQAASHLATCLRCYCRFLQFQGQPVAHLYAVVPNVPRERQGATGPVLTEVQVHALLNGFDRTRPKEQRDYAMTLCMVDLGMRGSDVTSLVLEDIDWRRGVIRNPNVKTHRPYPLPLPQRVGKALAEYIRKGRPQTPLREVFLSQQLPIRKMTYGSVQQIIRVAYERAKLPDPWCGSHILRRTAATRMHRAGVPLKEIADVLGHQSINTTLRYARLDQSTLATVALPWPEGAR